MHVTASASVPAVDAQSGKRTFVELPQAIFPFFRLPRELRDQIYDHAFRLQDDRSERALRIERRHLKYFKPSAASLLLVLHHEYFLLNQQVAREALEVLFKRHSIFISCGPFVLKSLLEKVDQQIGPGRQWLQWIKHIELDWVTFPNLTHYPPNREDGRDEWYWEHDDVEVDVDHVPGAQDTGHYDAYDHEGEYYDDNAYNPTDTSLYPSFQHPPTIQQATTSNDPFGFASHYPFSDPIHDPVDEASGEEVATNLDLLILLEVAPLFTYLASSTFNLTTITLPLYFVSRQTHHARSVARPGYTLPLKIRYWAQVCVHALLMLRQNTPTLPTLQNVRVKYLPWDVWASMDPADDLHRMVDRGVWFDAPEDGEGGERESEGEAFRVVWTSMRAKLVHEEKRSRTGLKADVKFVEWDGNVDSWRVGDELEVVFTQEA